MPSPLCEVRDGSGPYQSTAFGVDITPGNVVTIRLSDQSGVDAWSITCLTTDELSDGDAINAALVVDSATKTATFTAPVDFGRTLRFRSRINNGLDVNFVERDEYTTTFCIYARTVGGHRVLAVDERLEGDPDFGWIASFNDALRTPPSGEINTASNVGAAVALFKEKFGGDLRFRTLLAGIGISLTQNVDTVEIGAPVPTGGGFRKVVAGVEQPAAAPIDLADAADRTGVLPEGSGGTGNPNLAFPAGAETVVGRNTVDTLTNKTIDSASNLITLATGVLVSGVLGTPRGGLGLDNVALAASAGKLLRAHESGSGVIELAEPVFGIGSIGHRLTGSSGVPIQIADLTAFTTIYLTPYIHTYIHLWDGSRWRLCETEEISVALGTLISDRNYDVFAYWTGSAVALELSAAWASNTARTDALARRNGVLVKSADHTRRFLGTFRTISATQTANWYGRRLLWNHYNRVRLGLLRQETADSWTYASSVYRAARADTNNNVQFVSGDQTHLDLSVQTMAYVTATGWGCTVGLGFNATNANHAHRYGGISNANAYQYVRAEYNAHVGVGYNIVYWTEISGGTTITFYGDIGSGGFFQYGMLGNLLG